MTVVGRELRRARDCLRTATAEAEDADVTERLDGLADQLDRFVDADRNPDPGRLARMQRSLSEVAHEADDDEVVRAVSDAKSALSKFAESLGGI